MKPTLGRIVHFVPPQECVGPKSLTMYAAIIAQVNDNDTCELATVGPNSLYFQHHVPFSQDYKPGHWSWPPREQVTVTKPDSKGNY